jgi:hypothetical protein
MPHIKEGDELLGRACWGLVATLDLPKLGKQPNQMVIGGLRVHVEQAYLALRCEKQVQCWREPCSYTKHNPAQDLTITCTYLVDACLLRAASLGHVKRE